MKLDFQFNLNYMTVNVDWIKAYIIKKKNHDECRCECKELNDWGTCKNKYVWNPKKYNCKCNKACKIDEYLDIKVCSREKRLFCKLALECENEILNTAETSLDDKEVTCKK